MRKTIAWRIVLPAVWMLGLWTVRASPSEAAGRTGPFDAQIRRARPRIFIRKDGFAGLTVAKLRRAVKGPELAPFRKKWPARPLGRAILWMLDGRQSDLDEAVNGLERMKVSGGSWSDKGIALMQLATLYDWLYDALDAETRAAVRAKIEAAADDAVNHIRKGRAPFFYSRTPGALAGLTLSGIALSGVSPKADGYLQVLRQWGVNDFFKAYEWVDGAATGATYTLFYTYVDLSCLCAAWWSATDRNPADWIRTHQGDWLNNMAMFLCWYMRPGFAFTDINDLYRPIWGSHDQFCQGLDVASYVTRNRHGRAWALRWLGRFGSALYHTKYAHNAIFRADAPAPASLSGMPRAQLFGRESCGYGFFRSSWPATGRPDTAAHVFFQCGDPMNVHGCVAAGAFQLFKCAPLAARSGRYGPYDSPRDQYHRNAISTNVVLFTDPAVPDDRGDQHTRRGLKSDHATWDQWLAIRKRHGHDVAQVLDWQVKPGETRCRADLTKANPATKCRRWIREWVWLADRHLIVLDCVERAKPDIGCRWQLHLPAQPRLAGRIISVTSRAPKAGWADKALNPGRKGARLFCQTLLPKKYSVILHDGGKAEAFQPAGQSLGEVPGNAYHHEFGGHVVQIDPGQEGSRIVFLHVLTAVVEAVTAGPEVSCRPAGPGKIEVTVDGTRTMLKLSD